MCSDWPTSLRFWWPWTIIRHFSTGDGSTVQYREITSSTLWNSWFPMPSITYIASMFFISLLKMKAASVMCTYTEQMFPLALHKQTILPNQDLFPPVLLIHLSVNQQMSIGDQAPFQKLRIQQWTKQRALPSRSWYNARSRIALVEKHTNKIIRNIQGNRERISCLKEVTVGALLYWVTGSRPEKALVVRIIIGKNLL